MNLPARDDLHLLAGAYALDALDDLERQRFEQHLPTCPSCQEDVASFADATASLATAAATPAPASLRNRVLTAVEATRQVSVRGRRPTPVSSAVRYLSVAAAVLLLVVGGAMGAKQFRQNRQLSARAAIVEAGDARMSHLTGGAGDIQVTYSASHGASLLVADGLPPAPANRAYELWIIVDGKPEPSVTFQTNGKGHAVVKINRVPPAGSVLAITEEPSGGSATPTTKPSHASPPI
jgi:anti-sigma-K factor RskA